MFCFGLKELIFKFEPKKILILYNNKFSSALYEKFGFMDSEKIENGKNVLKILTKNVNCIN